VGEVIEWYVPVPKAVLTVATKEEWDAQLGEESPTAAAKQVLTDCLEKVAFTDQVVVLTKDKDGTLGFIGNCESLAETLLFLELVKAKMLSRVPDVDNGKKF
jgi:hypothetical protein